MKRRDAVLRSLGSERGASSVLVVLLLLMLVVFGVLAVASSSANHRLTGVNAATTAAWYQVDRIGVVRLAEWKDRVSAAAEGTDRYLDGLSFLNGADTVLPEKIREQTALEWSFLETDQDRNAFLEILKPKLFYRLLLQLAEGQTDDATRIISLYDFESDAGLWSAKNVLPCGSLVNVAISLKPDSTGNAFRLEITLDVTAPAEGTAGSPALDVVKWKQVHESFEYDDSMQLWEGNVE